MIGASTGPPGRQRHCRRPDAYCRRRPGRHEHLGPLVRLQSHRSVKWPLDGTECDQVAVRSTRTAHDARWVLPCRPTYPRGPAERALIARMHCIPRRDQLVDAVCRPPRDDAYTDADLVGGRRASFRLFKSVGAGLAGGGWVLGGVADARGGVQAALAGQPRRWFPSCLPMRSRKYYRQDVGLSIFCWHQYLRHHYHRLQCCIPIQPWLQPGCGAEQRAGPAAASLALPPLCDDFPRRPPALRRLPAL